MDQYGKWAWCTSWAAGGETQGPSSPVSCQGLLEKYLQRHLPQTCSSGELLFVLSSCQHSVSDIHKRKKRFNWTLAGQHQGRKSNRKTSHWFIAVRNQMSGYHIWTHPSISRSQFRFTNTIPQSTCSRWEAGMAEQSRDSQLPAATQTNLFNWFWQVELGTGDTKDRGHGPKDARYWLWPFTEEHLCCVTSCLCS